MTKVLSGVFQRSNIFQILSVPAKKENPNAVSGQPSVNMLEFDLAKGTQSHKMMNTDKFRNQRWLSQHRCLFFVLVLTSVLFYICIVKKDMTHEWNSKQWIQHHSTKMFIVPAKQKLPSYDTKGPQAEKIAVAKIAGFPTKASSAVLSQTKNISSPHEVNVKKHIKVPVTKIQPVLQTQAAKPTLVPYVSPGPYFVEYPYEYHFPINEPRQCHQEKPFVVVVVQVAPRNRAHRDIIRSTWGSEGMVRTKVVKTFFLLGMQTGEDSQQVHEQLLQESFEHRDLIQSDFVDSYKNLTIKTMVMLEWLDMYCSTASYAMKIDSDVFLNVVNLVKLLLKAPKTNYLTGKVVNYSTPFREEDSKRYVPEEAVPFSLYPPYPYGLGYVFSLDLPKKLVEASRHVKALYIEDAYLGMCMHHLGILPTYAPEKDYFQDVPLSYSPCALSKVIAMGIEPTIDSVKLWKDFKEQAKDCSKKSLVKKKVLKS